MNENLDGLIEANESCEIKTTTNTILTSQEIQNLAAVEDRLQRDSKYIHIRPGESQILDFILSKPPEEVQGRAFNGKVSTRTRFLVRYPEDEENREDRFFDVNKRSTRIIITKLKQGHRRLKIERVGSGLDTTYIAHAIYAR
jgi:hypothetical protein